MDTNKPNDPTTPVLDEETVKKRKLALKKIKSSGPDVVIQFLLHSATITNGDRELIDYILGDFTRDELQVLVQHIILGAFNHITPVQEDALSSLKSPSNLVN